MVGVIMTLEFVVVVSNSGGLGMFGVGYMSLE